MPVIPAAYGVTIPLPLEPDIEQLRRLQATNNNVTSCYISVLFNCSPPGGDTDFRFLQLVLNNDIVYYTLPAVVLTGIACDVISTCLLVRLLGATRCRCHDNAESRDLVYLAWLMASSALLLLCGGLEILPDYIQHSDLLQLMYGYVRAAGHLFSPRTRIFPAGHWLSYSCLWILVTMCLDKALQLTTSTFNNSSCESRTARRSVVKEFVVCISVHAVCLVSSLPHFFTFHTIHTFDLDTNRTVIISRVSVELVDSFEYSVVYFWYTVCLTVFLPLPLLLTIVVVLVRSQLTRSRKMRKKVIEAEGTSESNNHKVSASKGILSHKSRTAAAGGSELMLTASSSHTIRLETTLILLFVVCTAPRTILLCTEGILHHGTINSPSTGSTSIFYAAVQSLAQFAFYFYYASALPLLCSYKDKFRALLIASCCCCIKRRPAAFVGNHCPSSRKTVKFDTQTVEFEIQC